MQRPLSGSRAARNLAVLAATLLGTLGLVLAQDPPQPDPKAPPARAGKDKNKGKGKEKDKGPLVPNKAVPKNRRNNADPLGVAAKAAVEPGKAAVALPAPVAPPAWPFHYKIKIADAAGNPLAALYYPPRTKMNAPVVMLVHERGPGRSGKDFEEPLEELKNKGLAEHLQEQGYAVLVLDLRGHGRNPRREVAAPEWRVMMPDLQNAYAFLIDRHNRGEFNLAKLGVVAMGDAANLAAAWASLPEAAVSPSPGGSRAGDLSGLVLVSPVADSQGLALQQILAPIAPRLPILLACGDRDMASLDAVKAAQPLVERHQRSRVAFFDTALHSYKLLHFFNKTPAAITRFLDDAIKARIIEWEPRYLLEPVPYQSEGVVETKPDAAPARPAEAKKAGN